MALTDKDIETLQALYKSEFGLEISREDAYVRGMEILCLMSTVYKPMSQEDYEEIQKHREETLPLLQEHFTHETKRKLYVLSQKNSA